MDAEGLIRLKSEMDGRKDGRTDGRTDGRISEGVDCANNMFVSLRARYFGATDTTGIELIVRELANALYNENKFMATAPL